MFKNTEITKEKTKEEKNKEAKQGCIIVIVIIAIVVGIVQLCDSGKTKNLTQPQKDSIVHQNWITNQFSAWDGSHTETVKMIKEDMNDPDSYKHVETTYRDFGQNGLIITTTFRGSNMLGGIVKNTAISKVDTTGKIYYFKVLSE